MRNFTIFVFATLVVLAIMSGLSLAVVPSILMAVGIHGAAALALLVATPVLATVLVMFVVSRAKPASASLRNPTSDGLGPMHDPSLGFRTGSVDLGGNDVYTYHQ